MIGIWFISHWTDWYKTNVQAMFNQETDAMEALEGPIQFTHQFVDMPKYEFNVEDPVEGTKKVTLQLPAIIESK